MGQQQEIEKVRRAIEDRGSYLLYIYRQLQISGVENAKEILCQAISEWGKAKSSEIPISSPCAFIQKLERGNLPEVYQRNVLQSDGELARMEMQYCPLVAAWKKAGATQEELSDLCDIASEGDYSSVGPKLKLTFEQRLADGDACCLMKVVRR